MNTNRLEVSQIFDRVVSDVDLRVEQFASNNKHKPELVESICSLREVWIKEIRECEAYNIAFLENETAPLSNEQRIKRYCFVIETFINTVESTSRSDQSEFGYILVSLDKYVSPGQVACFQAALKFMPGSVFDSLFDFRAQGMLLYYKNLSMLFTEVNEKPLPKISNGSSILVILSPKPCKLLAFSSSLINFVII
jgi:hypothetical protein